MRSILLLAIAVGFAVGAPEAHGDLVVNSVGDEPDALPGDGACATSVQTCTLRAAIEEANNLLGPELIRFQLDPVPASIRPATPLPPITDMLDIDGRQAPGEEGPPVIEVSGADLTISVPIGIDIRADQCSVGYLIVNGFLGAGELSPGIGIRISGGFNRILGCYVGTDPTGTEERPNGIGVSIVPTGDPTRHAYGNVIGGVRNVVSANRTNISVTPGNQIPLPPEGVVNRVAGNLIGTDATGMSLLADTSDVEQLIGVFVTSSRAVIGGARGVEGNVISGHRTQLNELYRQGAGILLEGAAEGVLVQGNNIGVDVNGEQALSNDYGVDLDSGGVYRPNCLIGGENPCHRNVISGNRIAGIRVINVLPVLIPPYLEARIQGNTIGLDETERFKLGNGIGIRLRNSSRGLIGTEGAGNVIAGNGTGIELQGRFGARSVDTANAEIIANYIGTNRSLDPDLGNGRGIELREYSRARIGNIGSEDSEVDSIPPWESPPTAENLLLDPKGNVIAYNLQEAILGSPSGYERGELLVRRNSIFGNGGPPISYIGALAGLAGVSELQVLEDERGLLITGRLSTADHSFSNLIDFYANPGCGEFSVGEGWIWIGSYAASGYLYLAPFETRLQTVLPPGTVITATLSASYYPRPSPSPYYLATSPFSECAVVSEQAAIETCWESYQ